MLRSDDFFRNPSLPVALSRLLESPWKRHQSKDMLFLHRNCKQFFFSTSKKIFPMNFFSDNFGKIEKFEIFFHRKFPFTILTIFHLKFFYNRFLDFFPENFKISLLYWFYDVYNMKK